MKKVLLLLVLLFPSIGYAQEPGLVPRIFGQSYSDNAPLRFGKHLDVYLNYNTNQTPATMTLGLSAESNSLVITEKADISFDFAHALQTHPTLFIHSNNQATNEWISISHDGANGIINVGTGSVTLPGGVSTSGNISTTGTITSSNTGSLGWNLVSAANQACNTTCTNACVFGQDTATSAIVDCADATADACICAGAN